jgi:metal-responsive CopG/Arc/MetJ family transcriptional regulator
MKILVSIEDALYEKALEFADPDMDDSDLIREAIKTFIRMKASKRLIAWGGSLPQMQEIPDRSGNQ